MAKAYLGNLIKLYGLNVLNASHKLWRRMWRFNAQIVCSNQLGKFEENVPLLRCDLEFEISKREKIASRSVRDSDSFWVLANKLNLLKISNWEAPWRWPLGILIAI